MSSYVDNRGKLRHVFRRKGYRKTTFTEKLGSPEFLARYYALLNEEPLDPLEPLSTLVGGIRAKRGVDPNTVQPLIGVYLLLLKGKIVYIGSSLHMPRRVADHRSNGRPFDQAYYIATMANQREKLEAILIRTMNPLQNKKHRAVVERNAIKDCQTSTGV